MPPLVLNPAGAVLLVRSQRRTIHSRSGEPWVTSVTSSVVGAPTGGARHSSAEVNTGAVEVAVMGADRDAAAADAVSMAVEGAELAAAAPSSRRALRAPARPTDGEAAGEEAAAATRFRGDVTAVRGTVATEAAARGVAARGWPAAGVPLRLGVEVARASSGETAVAAGCREDSAAMMRRFTARGIVLA